MKKFRKRDNEVSYWESMADGLVALLLCILLILMLLILYLMRATEEVYVGENNNSGAENGGYGYSYEESYEYHEEDDSYHDEGGEDDDDDGGGGGNPYEDPDPGMGDGDGSDKAAVLVQVVDGETQRTIKKSGIKFELYNTASALQVLSTYYPVKKDYKLYETDKEGMFYLPEKIVLGTYYLHDLTPIDGYDLVDNWEFTVDDDYDWSDPYLATVEVFPSKNFIRLQVKDSESGDSVKGASFEVVAAENILTQDGTTRFQQGEVADTIEVDEDGNGTSKELYLGKYLIRQKTVPEYYSILANDTAVEVKNKSVEAEPPLNELLEQKTTIAITVADALYADRPINGATFEVATSAGEKVATVKTDSDGKAAVTNLRKGFTYVVSQKTTADKYKMDYDKYTFTVGDTGLINGNSIEDLSIQNGIVRASFGVKDKLFKNDLSDINVAVLDKEGKTVQSWNTSAVENVIEGIEPGEYKVVLGGDSEHAYSVVVGDIVEVQNFRFEKWTLLDIGCIVAGAAGAALIIALLIILNRRRRKNKKAGD